MRGWRQWQSAMLAVTIALLASGAWAQDFPVKGKPITIIVPYAAGGVTDTGARVLAAAMEKELGTPVQVVNKIGAASQIGLSELVRSAPDGHTLSYALLPTVVTHYLDPSRAAIYTRKDFQPVAMHHYAPNLLAVKSDSPYRTLKDLVDAARAKPESIRVGDPGLLSVPHVQAMMLEQAAGVRLASVHFGGGALSVTSLLGGHIDVLAGVTADVLPHKMSGAFRVLGVAAEQPDKSMPDVPTIRSQGYDVLAATWTGIVAPFGTPDRVIGALTKAIRKVIESPEHQKKLDELALGSAYLDPAAYAKLWIDTETRVKPLLEKLLEKK